MAQGKVEQVTSGVKHDKNNRPYFSAKIGSAWYSVAGTDDNRQEVINKNVSYTVTKPAQGNYNAWIKIDAVESPMPASRAGLTPAPDTAKAASHGNGSIAWDEYEEMAKMAHSLASELEPDGSGPTDDPNRVYSIIDRSAARAAILNTVMIAFSNGKIAKDKKPDDGGNVVPF